VNENPSHEFASALQLLERYTTKPELLAALWYLLRVQDPEDDRPMAYTLTVLVLHLNRIRRMRGDKGPITVSPFRANMNDANGLAAERLALACASALSLQTEAER